MPSSAQTPDQTDQLGLLTESVIPIFTREMLSNPSFDLVQLKAVNLVSATRKNLYTLFQPAIKEQLARELMANVLLGNPEKARELYTYKPELLFMPVTMPDLGAGLDINFKPVYRIINSNPVRAMVGGGDVWMRDDVLNALPAYRDRIVEQIYQQFPNGFDYPEATFNYTPLVAAITADHHLINTGNPNEQTEAELIKFRTYFLPNQDPNNETIGHHFNMNEYIKAAGVYKENWTRWRGHQYSLFFKQVIGALQTLFAVADGQALIKNPENIDMPGSKNLFRLLRRNLKFINHANNKVEQSLFDRRSSSIHGRDFAIDVYWTSEARCGRGEVSGRPEAPGVFENLCRAKTASFQNLYPDTNERNQLGV